MQRVSFVGPGGSGKTTGAARIADSLGLPHLELDSIHWLRGRTPLDTDRLRSHVDEFTAGDRCVVDGNHSKVRDIVTSRAGTVVWLRHSRPIVMGRLIRPVDRAGDLITATVERERGTLVRTARHARYGSEMRIQSSAVSRARCWRAK